ncbi:Gfo/Idh/MocA family protein [Halobaculum sp. D14]|uniref:Gfo/Idh/MocA family protein n=1 Tax=Halobaculum sp. D14 TaxID=3421642 RepID=UPI003EB72493
MTLDVGFIGYRFMGKAHANALSRLSMFFPEAPETNRAVVVGRDEDALTDARDRLGFDRAATDWEDVVDDVDVLYNLGPNFLHVEPSVAALDAGVHVLCEKPLAPTKAGAEQMASAAAESDAVAGCGFNYRFIPAIQLAKRLIDAGELGEIRQVRGRYLQDWLVDADAPWTWRMDAERAGSGALGDLGAHTVDLVQFLVDDVVGVSGRLETFVEERDTPAGETRPVTVDDAYSAQATLANGATCTLEASRVAAGHKNDHTIEVHGSKGSLRFSLERLNELELMREGARGYETVLVTDEDDPYLDHWWPPGHVLGWEHTFVHENYEFLSAVAGDDSFRPSFDDARRVQAVLDAVERSDACGEWVDVDADR